MVEIKMKTRLTGATASLPARGHASLKTETGGELDVVTSVSAPGFNPLDLLYSALASCLVLSVNGAVVKLQMVDRFEGVTAHVTGEKAHDGISRVETIRAVIKIAGDYSDAEREAIRSLAKELCTVSNTLTVTPNVEVTAEAL